MENWFPNFKINYYEISRKIIFKINLRQSDIYLHLIEAIHKYLFPSLYI